jgi:hypothetical protein
MIASSIQHTISHEYDILGAYSGAKGAPLAAILLDDDNPFCHDLFPFPQLFWASQEQSPYA